ncbi:MULTISPECIES: peptidase [unclassified Streptomyces]|uniref:peptidase n=1 Tax=unclassified Streptomyces TaxID=2593676 RepID=UPI002DDAF64C|nr:peptidase [Streptomyces sp. NBC_01750]WSB03438.1 peptidase [Streptomyces sp. NBC_01794]WSD32292.1 peptidase [Streptomyces sp. NBC_01750]
MTCCSTCSVPVHTQFASPDLIEQIVYGGLDPATDPAWESSGAMTREEYGRWCGHLCGMTCLRMALGPGSPSLFELRDGALKYGAYTEDSDGVIRGLIYAPLASYAREVHALTATVHRRLAPQEILALLDEGRTVMASVHYEIRNPDRPAPGRGGHLVLLTARTEDRVHFHNPSGTTPRTRAADLPLADFARFFAGRGVSFGPAAASGPGPERLPEQEPETGAGNGVLEKGPGNGAGPGA